MVDSVETCANIAVIRILSSKKVSLEIPIQDLKECDVNLEKLVGKKISILRTNIGYLLELNSQTDDLLSTVLRG
jgi:hypothetical protein